MNISKLLALCLLSIPLVVQKSFGQSCSIEVTTEIKGASQNEIDGSISFTINNLSTVSDQFLIFDLNAVKEGRANEVKLMGNQVRNLRKGQYEFLIVDKYKRDCLKEIQVEIQDRKEGK